MADAPRYRVMFVDDDRLAIKLAERVFRKDEDMEVVATMSANEAIAIAMSEPIDLIVADQRMPEMTGLMLLARIREVCPTAVRFLLTAHPELDVALKAINQGILDRFILKPWDAKLMRSTIRQTLVEKRAKEKDLAADRAMRKWMDEWSRTELMSFAQRYGARAAARLDTVETRIAHALSRHGDDPDLAAALEQIRSVQVGLRYSPRSPPATPEAHDLTKTVRMALERVRHHNRKIELEVPQDFPRVVHQGRLMETAIVELLDNALLNTEPGEHVGVRLWADEGQAFLEVSNAGPAIAQDVQERMFQPFVSTRPGGAGLGLWLAKEIVGAHGGRLTFDRRDEGGSSFRIRLDVDRRLRLVADPSA